MILNEKRQPESEWEGKPNQIKRKWSHRQNRWVYQEPPQTWLWLNENKTKVPNQDEDQTGWSASSDDPKGDDSHVKEQ